MKDLQGNGSNSVTPNTLELETRSIDYIPAAERQGHPRDLLTLWFGANAMAITLVTGGVASTFGIGLVWSSLAIVIGAVLGVIFVAYHSAQGPQLGLPQMIQSRAQFGFYGANLPMLIVVAMYLGFFAGGAVIASEAATALWGFSTATGVAIVAIASLIFVIFGYKLLHFIGKIITPVYILVFSLLTFALASNWQSFPAPSVEMSKFELTPFMAIISIIAAYYISYGPYVADYSRYLPETTSTAKAFWYTYAGVISSAVWIMVLGAAIQSFFSTDDTIGGAAAVAASVGNWLRNLTLITLIVGIAYIHAFNLYGAMMSTLTIGSSLFRNMKVGAGKRAAFVIVIAIVGGMLAGLASKNFILAFESFIVFIITFLIPWSAVNLVDYYGICRGKYSPQDLFTPDGRYGSFNRIGLFAYLVGCFAQIPFIDHALYRGYMAKIIGFDIAWIVGLVVPGTLYYALAKKRRAPAPAMLSEI